MKLIGIPLRKLGWAEFTAAFVMGMGLWIAALGFMHVGQVTIDAVDAGALLLVVTWACISTRMGVRLDQGSRHLAANLLVSMVLLGVYEGAMALWS